MGALSNPRVAEFIEDNFVAAHQQVGTFEVVEVNGRLQKNGGNVASYFLTPQGHVIHSVAGQVDADRLLAEARWAVETWQSVQGRRPWEIRQAIAEAHRYAAEGNSGRQQRVHRLLAEKPVPPLGAVSEEIFARILNERPIRDYDYRSLQRALEGIRHARSRNKPMLLVLHRDRENDRSRQRWQDTLAAGHESHRCRWSRCRRDPLTQLAGSYATIGLPLRLLPVLSEELGVEPYRVPSRSSTLLVVTRSDGEQVDVVTNWNDRDRLTRALAEGLIAQAAHEDAPPQRLQMIYRLVKPVDESYGEEILRMIREDNGREQLVASADPVGR